MRIRSPGRLFWKLLGALWASMLFSFAATFLLLYVTGFRPPGAGGAPANPLFPAVPLVIGALTMAVVGSGLAWYLAKPLKQLKWGLREASQGRFDTRVQPLMGSRRDEIVDLATEFDAMALKLQQATESRRVLLHDISHELRSPLTRMQAAIGLVRQAPSKTTEMLDRIEGEAERLDELIGELLTLHRLEAGGHYRRERVDVIELLHAIADDADFEARATGRSVEIDAPESFVAKVNGELIYRAFENVIRNAVKFSPASGTVQVIARVDAQSGAMTCRVLDEGPGVPDDMLETIFQPFARVEQQEASGVGLGLAIAKRAIEAHGGQIAAARRQTDGLEVEIRLPANAP